MNKGFTLIETLVGSIIFLIIALSAYNAFGVLMNIVAASRAKLAATSVANEKFEIIRNLPYSDVGIIAGIPAGKIQRNQTIARDNYSFDVLTTIRNFDDPFDGTIGGNPSDSSPADYKLVDLDITCSNCKIFTPLNFTTLVGPHALETASNNGALFIRVFDNDGLGVAGAEVHIMNTETNPDTIIDETTDNSGWVKIVDAPTGVNAYSIIGTKSGFTTDQTYLPGGAAGTDPVNSDATVVLQEVTQAVLSIDRVSSIAVSSVNSLCEPLSDVEFSLTGTKIIGLPQILKYPTQNFTTDENGNYTISNFEWDTYSTLLTSASYDLAGVNPFPNFVLAPNENKNLRIIAVPHVNRSLLVSVQDTANTPIDDASVRLEKNDFDETQTTNSEECQTPGQVFWNGLESGNYTLTVTKTGFETSVTSVDISSNWKNENIILEP
ncbi:hypothetical protein A3D42_02340 [Candidatus Nomurabacteria bacterium RIFCSPHIGHO2_02_FULL_41_18]|uniref:PEGA domain-containing protein n=1 Tax=Candidatus Nomurabacteria bacterium RIFCSPHIGHO2_02_FULL_41_18 TaxID=1801754 RepID=A0A1F6W4W9_9BACT|nr:MAG: hypothetical protein A2737_01925 [Candidatus Nomurabacteria bacterium RIFCSPHIGHO2_01_FULL_41_71]OGI76949.1 MAG: hypothetical protein A3D42_02340 [Candidatus Nomurabacteria bacterium RIFCSPHIGHO2_02_FULL_41_18]OGI89459.1 MAG: hypothetical protein A3B01_01045 [Candidatus Nomurabacteria bacterium RIFCSPLOWO2_01_FULL_41_52b]